MSQQTERSLVQIMTSLLFRAKHYQNSAVILFTEPLGMNHDDVIKWKHFPCYWSFVRGIHR